MLRRSRSISGHDDDRERDLEDRTVLLADDDILFFDQDVSIPNDRAQPVNESVLVLAKQIIRGPYGVLNNV